MPSLQAQKVSCYMLPCRFRDSVKASCYSRHLRGAAIAHHFFYHGVVNDVHDDLLLPQQGVEGMGGCFWILGLCRFRVPTAKPCIISGLPQGRGQNYERDWFRVGTFPVRPMHQPDPTANHS